MGDATLLVIGAVVGAILLGLGALVRHRAAARRRLVVPRGEAGAGSARPGLSPTQEVQGAPPETDEARRDR